MSQKINMSAGINEQGLSHDREQGELLSVDDVAARIDALSTEQVGDGPIDRMGAFNGLPSDIDAFRSKDYFTNSSEFTTVIVSEDGPVRSVSALWHGGSAGKGSMGYNIYPDGTLARIVKGGPEGKAEQVVDRDNPEEYQQHLERAMQMMNNLERAKEEAVAKEAARYDEIAEKLGGRPSRMSKFSRAVMNRLGISKQP